NLLNWVRYTVSNLGKTDQYCPAGKKENHNIRIKRTLPPDFQLTEEWLRRLYDIAISTSFTSEGQVHGICGTCLLQTFQMLAELQEYHSHGPIQGGGYFFNTAHDRDPFDSFRQRYPELDAMLVNIPIVYSQDGNVPRMGLASARTMLPQYDWTLSREFTTRSEMLSHITSLIASPPGSMWLSMFRVRRPDGTTGGHAVPILRTSQGLVVIPTNSASLSFFTYRRFATPTTDPVQVMNNLEMSSWTLEILVTAQLEGLYYNTFDFTISNR
ncbi:DUF1561 family protein, partial [Leptospira interrogans]